MHAVAQTHVFVRRSKEVGMTEEEVEDLVSFIAENPKAGDEIPGTGGCRKVRSPRRGKGKRSGYRTITFFTGEVMPVFLLDVYGKGEKSNLSQAELNALRKLTKGIVEAYQSRVSPVARKGA
jgi:hypothetical protein